MYRWLLYWSLFVTASLASRAQPPNIGKESVEAHFVTQRQVRAALLESLRGTDLEALAFDEDDIAILAIPVKGSAPDLQVLRVTADAKRGVIEARLRCLRQECLPFCASVRPGAWPASANGQSMTIAMSPQTQLRAPPSKGQRPLVSVGDAAQLFVVTPGIRITIPVICLQPGSVGQLIRLRAVATGTVLMGRVESKGVLSNRGMEQ